MKYKQALLIFIGILISADLFWLNYSFFSMLSKEEKVMLVEASPVNKVTETPVNTTYITKQDLDSSIRVATESLTQQITVLSNASKKTVNQTPETKQLQTSVKEFYIPLGTGSTSSQNWVDISGAEAYIVPSNYGSIASVYFEAAIRIPTGNGQVFARLRNVTDNVSLFESEISQKDTQIGLISSGLIPPPTTTKLYRVQLRSSLGAQVVLDNARIKLFVQ